jgi:hypothetical protein
MPQAAAATATLRTGVAGAVAPDATTVQSGGSGGSGGDCVGAALDVPRLRLLGPRLHVVLGPLLLRLRRALLCQQHCRAPAAGQRG